MTESIIHIQGPDNNVIYGKMNDNGQEKLIIHVHGMTHYASGLLEVTGSEYFTVCGYDYYRPSLYDLPHNSRKLSNSTVSTHMKDIQSILDFFAPKYKSIYMIGHSLGGLSTFLLNPKGVKAISLWDPSMDVTHFWSTRDYLKHIPELQMHLLDYGNIYALGEAMVDEMKTFTNAYCLEHAKKVTTPTQFIIPDESIFLASPHTSPEEYKGRFSGPFDLYRLKGGNHTFSNEGNRPPLFEATRRWFEAHP